MISVPVRPVTLLVALAALLTGTEAGAAPSGRASAATGKRIVALPRPCPGGACEAGAAPAVPAPGLRLVYLNFDGVTLVASDFEDDSRSNTSGILSSAIPSGQSRTLGAFDPFELDGTEGLSRAQIIDRVIDDLYRNHSPYNIEFVTQRPSSGPYSMVVFGGTCESVLGQSGCAGVALLDCGDFMSSNITFVFPPGLRVSDLAVTASQEAAHAFGLAHTTDDTDIMFPVIQFQSPDHYGAGSLPDNDQSCGGALFQDSHQKMLDTIGPRAADTIGPAVTITTPAPGENVRVGDTVAASANDASDVVKVELVIGGTVVAERTSEPWQFSIPDDTALGNLSLQVRAYDTFLNTGNASVDVVLIGATGELGEACTMNEECISDICATADGMQLCSEACSATDPCPEGFECRGGVACWPDGGGGDGDGNGDGEGGCAATGDAGAVGGLWLALLALLAIRRRGQRQR